MTSSADPTVIVAPLVEVWIDVKTVSEANTASHQHWRARDRRSRSQINHVIALMYRDSVANRRAWDALRLPLHVVLNRFSKSGEPLDDDNLPASLKGVQDGVCDALGIYMKAGYGPRRMTENPLAANQHFDDGDRLTWSYRQTVSAKRAGVLVRLYAPNTMANALKAFLREHGPDALATWFEDNGCELDRILP